MAAGSKGAAGREAPDHGDSWARARLRGREGQWVAAFVQRLRQLGWIEGRTVSIEVRWAEGRYERFAEIAAEFVRLKVDVIVTAATAPVVAASRPTSVIPIVFAVAGDPVGSGLVASLARPGGNVTGLSLQQTDLAAKQLELLRQVMPALRRLAIMGNAGSPMIVLELREVQATARSLGLEVSTLEIGRPDDIRLPSRRRSRTAPTHFTSVPTRWLTITEFESFEFGAGGALGNDVW